MKKFNLKHAQEGSGICTRSGKDAKIILYDRESPHFPLVAIIENKDVTFYTLEGKWKIDEDSDKDLFIK